MTWIKLDDRAPRHPKVSGLSDRSFRWWIYSLCYSSEFLTDGELPYAFLKTAPAKVQAELRHAQLWVTDTNGVVSIHDYLTHQNSRAVVERTRTHGKERAARSRNVRANVQRTFADGSQIVRKPDTEADTETDTEKQQQHEPTKTMALIRSPLDIHRARERCAYVGARLEVPHGLHADLMRGTGADAHTRLMAWYAELDAEIEASGEAIVPDVFKWLRGKWQTWLTPQQKATTKAAQLQKMIVDATAYAEAHRGRR